VTVSGRRCRFSKLAEALGGLEWGDVLRLSRRSDDRTEVNFALLGFNLFHSYHPSPKGKHQISRAKAFVFLGSTSSGRQGNF